MEGNSQAYGLIVTMGSSAVRLICCRDRSDLVIGRQRERRRIRCGFRQFPHHKMHLGALARAFPARTQYCVGHARHCVQGVKRVAVHNLSARWCKPTLRRVEPTHFSDLTCQSVTMPFRRIRGRRISGSHQQASSQGSRKKKRRALSRFFTASPTWSTRLSMALSCILLLRRSRTLQHYHRRLTSSVYT